MKDMSIKEKVLGEILSLMDEKDGEMLKKHPKLMAMKVETVGMGGPKMMKGKEMPEGEMEEEMGEDEGPEMELENLDPETLAKLMKLIK